MPGPGYYWIGKEEEEEVIQVLRSRYLFRYGPENDPSFLHKVKDFETALCEKLGCQYALATSSGTAALITALSAAGIGPGDEVIVPGYTFIATMSAVIHCGAVPILAEVDESLTLDPLDLEQKITPYTRAIIPVHMLGNPCNMESIRRISEKYRLIVIEDACQAFGGSYRGEALGTISDVGTVSFNIFKVINSGDGGVILTNDRELYERSFSYHDQGHLPNRLGVEVGHRSVIGQNFRMNEVTAAVLLAQLRKIDAILTRLRMLKSIFKDELQSLPGLSFRRINDPEECATLLTILLPEKRAADLVASHLGTKTLAHSGWHVYNNMEQILGMKTINPRMNPASSPFYKGKAEYYKGMLPKTDQILERSINISIGVVDAGLGASFGVNINSTTSDVQTSSAIIRKAVAEVLGVNT